MVQPMQRGLNPLSVNPEYEAWYLDFFEHADYDAFWKDPMVNWSEHYAETADIPMIQIGGWYDIFLAGTFQNLRRALEAQEVAAAPPRWAMDASREHATLRRRCLVRRPRRRSRTSTPTFHLRWFDHFLKGEATGVESDAPIRLFVMGTGDGHKDADGRLFHGGYWRDETAWPIAGTRMVPYYFHADGSLSPTRANGVEIVHDLHVRSAPIRCRRSAAARRRGSRTARTTSARIRASRRHARLTCRSAADPTCVVFETAPLTEDMEVIGPITVVVFASSNRTDTDFTAKLIDVYPPSADWPGGFDLNLTDAIMRGRYRATRDHAELLTPGTVYPFTIEPFPTANVFKKGHRIRVDISSSNFPRFDANPNTGEPLGKNRRTGDGGQHHAITAPRIRRASSFRSCRRGRDELDPLERRELGRADVAA